MQIAPAQGSGGVIAIRAVSQWERELLAQWFAGTERTGPQAVVAAYVSERSRDNPRLRNMIIIAEHSKNDMAFLIYRPVDETAWVVECGRSGKELGHHRTLPEALGSIRSQGILPEVSSSVVDGRQLINHSSLR